jgi:hypothetical protein
MKKTHTSRRRHHSRRNERNRSSGDFMVKGMKAERKEKKQETWKKRLGRVLKQGFS